MTEKFYQKNIGKCGSRVRPDTLWSDEIYCKKCNKEAKVISEKKKTWRSFEYDETFYCTDKIVKCKKCKIKGKISVGYGSDPDESDMEKYGYRGANYGC